MFEYSTDLESEYKDMKCDFTKETTILLGVTTEYCEYVMEHTIKQ